MERLVEKKTTRHHLVLRDGFLVVHFVKQEGDSDKKGLLKHVMQMGS